MTGFHLLVVPNDDGFGPSALASYIVKAILRLHPDCRFTVWNSFAFEFNRQLYAREVATARGAVHNISSLIRLIRPTGDVSLAATLESMSGYRSRSDNYPGEGTAGTFDLVLDFGAPAAARWAVTRGIPSVTVFDHAWSETLRMILEGAGTAGMVEPALAQAWSKLASEIGKDELFTRRLFLFPEIITPLAFHRYWGKILPLEAIHTIPGVLRQASCFSRRRVRQALGLLSGGETVLVQGGGSAVWNEPLRMLAAQLLDSGQSERLVKANVNLVIWFPAGVLAPDLADALDAIARVRRLKAVPGGTIQSILPGIDYVFMRAGGGSVNDVIAQRRPFVCVREPGQSQIEAILAECLRAGTTLPAVEPRTFAQDPLGVVLEQVTLLEGNRTRLLSSMRRIPGRGEQPLAQMIFKGLSSPNDLSAGHRLTSAPAKSDPGSRA